MIETEEPKITTCKYCLKKNVSCYKVLLTYFWSNSVLTGGSAEAYLCEKCEDYISSIDEKARANDEKYQHLKEFIMDYVETMQRNKK